MKCLCRKRRDVEVWLQPIHNRHYEVGGQHHAPATLPLGGVQNAGWVGLNSKENVDPTGIRSPDRPVSGESL